MIQKLNGVVRTASGTFGPGDEKAASEAAAKGGWDLDRLAAKGVIVLTPVAAQAAAPAPGRRGPQKKSEG